MKRVPLKRKSPLKRGDKPLKRYTPLRQRRPGKKSEPGSAAYLAWIRQQACVVCAGSRGPSQAAHTHALGAKPFGRKASAYAVIPLCVWDHTLRDDSYHSVSPEWRWAEHHGVDVKNLVERYRELFTQGR